MRTAPLRNVRNVTALAAVCAVLTTGVLVTDYQPPHRWPAVVPTQVGPAYGGDKEATEDGPGWNCLTMGSGVCGPTWKRVTATLGDVLAEGLADGDDTYPWESCFVEHTISTTVVCPDGRMVTW